MPVWDRSLNQVIGPDGARSSVPYLVSEAQVMRWTAAGFDLAAAIVRNEAIVDVWNAAQTARESSQILRAFFAGERQTAVSEGVPEDDPDLWRIDVAPKAFWWEPPHCAVV